MAKSNKIITITAHVFLAIASLGAVWEYLPEKIYELFSRVRNTDIIINEMGDIVFLHKKKALVIIALGISLLYTKYFKAIRTSLGITIIAYVLIFAGFFIGVYVDFLIFENYDKEHLRSVIDINNCLQSYVVAPTIILMLILLMALFSSKFFTRNISHPGEMKSIKS
jgi:hypothetical protein